MKHSASSRCVAPVRYMVTGRVACIYLPRHGHENDTADALPRLTYRRRPAFYTLSPRSNDLEVIRSPSNVRSNSSEKRHVNIVAALTVGLSARQPKERRQLVHHTESTRHGRRSPIAIGVTAISRAIKRLAMHIFLGACGTLGWGAILPLLGFEPWLVPQGEMHRRHRSCRAARTSCVAQRLSPQA